ncbi:MAG: hypothetical protein WCI17_10075, partial [bacterium]
AAAAWCLARGAVWGAVPLAWGGALAAEAVYVLSALALIRAPWTLYVRLAAAPAFLLWKIGVYLRMALAARRGKSGEWIRTDRQEMRR